MNDSATIVALIVGVLGFVVAILTFIYTNKNNRKNLELSQSIDRRDTQKSYNRVLGSLLKVYHSFLKHKMLFNEDGVEHMPDEVLMLKIEELDSFEDNIEYFKVVTTEESEIIPELTLYIHELIELLEKFRLVSEHFSSLGSVGGIPDDQLQLLKLAFMRAHNFSYQEILDEYFIDLIELISDKADVEDGFLEEVKSYNSEESSSESLTIQSKIKSRLEESLSRQLGEDFSFDDFFK